jgi:hypothetical protein
MLGLNTNGSDPSLQKPSVNRGNFSISSKSKAKYPTTSSANTDLSSIGLAYLNSHFLAARVSSVESQSLSTSRAARVGVANSSGWIKTGPTKSATAGLSATMQELCEPTMSPARKAQTQPRADKQLSFRSKDSKSSQCNKYVDTNEMTAKVKAKRSFREFFHLRDVNPTEKISKPTENKRSSLTFTGNTLAKRFRNSTNLSEPASTSGVPLRPESDAKARTQGDVGYDVTPSDDAGSAIPATCSDTGLVVNRILDSVSSLPYHSPDRLRGLEIAEVCTNIHFHPIMLQELVLRVQIKQTLLNAMGAHKQARISAAKAKKHARQAEMNAKWAGVELERMQKLCESDFDHETMRAIRKLVK